MVPLVPCIGVIFVPVVLLFLLLSLALFMGLMVISVRQLFVFVSVVSVGIANVSEL
jgi:hypothetical protein